MHLLYNLILILIAPILIPYAIFKGIPYGASIRNVLERSGFIPALGLQKAPGQQLFWIHAVSVGEVYASCPLIDKLRKTYPDAKIVMTCMTFTGNKVARSLDAVDHALFFPFDLPWVVRRFVSRLDPTAVIVIETEIWPNFVSAVKSFDIPLILVNGRISDKSFTRYLKLGKVFQSALECITVFCMQSAKDERRIRRLGAPPGRIVVSGNMKFDMELPESDRLDVASLINMYSRLDGQQVIVAGSTHEGEEVALANVYQRLRLEFPNLTLVLIPRHPERCRQVCDDLAKIGLNTILRTTFPDQQQPLPPEDVIVVDTVGEVLRFYAWADIIFVGGSLVPIGGHNILEAALSRKAVLFGPYMNNFKEITKLVKEAYAGIQVKSSDDLFNYAKLLLDNPEEAARIGENGFELLSRNRGATERTISEIERRI